MLRLSFLQSFHFLVSVRFRFHRFHAFLLCFLDVLNGFFQRFFDFSRVFGIFSGGILTAQLPHGDVVFSFSRLFNLNAQLVPRRRRAVSSTFLHDVAHLSFYVHVVLFDYFFFLESSRFFPECIFFQLDFQVCSLAQDFELYLLRSSRFLPR